MIAAVFSLVLAAASHVNAADLSYQDLMSAVVECVDLRNILKTYECTRVVAGPGAEFPPHCKCFLACVGEEMKMLTADGRVDVAGALETVELDGSTDALDVADSWRQCDIVSNSTTGCEKAFETLLCLWGRDTFIPRYSDDHDTRRFIKLLSKHSRNVVISSAENLDVNKESEE